MHSEMQEIVRRNALPPDVSEGRIGYVLKGYARTSETFITNEIALLERRGLNLTIFSFLELSGQLLHAAVETIKSPVHYLPPVTPLSETHFFAWLARNAPPFAQSHKRLFALRPSAYLKTLAEAISLGFKHRRGAWRQPETGFLKEFLQAGVIAEQALALGNIRHLHAHFCHTTTTVTMFASRLSGLPFSFTAHAKDIYVAQHNPGDLLSRKMRRARFVVTCTAANQRHLTALCPDGAPVHLVYHGLNPRQFVPAAASTVNAMPLILSVGRLVEKKGFPYLIEACRRLKERGYQFQCQIVGGTGAFATQVVAAVKAAQMEDTVWLRPAVTQEELQLIYQQAAVFVLPSQITDNGDRDGIPNVLVEAMALGLPVVSTNVSGIPELVTNRVNGLLAPQKDPEALAQAIAELLDHPELGRQFGQAARQTVCREFDAEETIVDLHQLFQVCLTDVASGSAGASREL